METAPPLYIYSRRGRLRTRKGRLRTRERAFVRYAQ